MSAALVVDNTGRLPGEDLFDFCNGYEPMTYLIEGIARNAYMYTMTARTGAGKTAFNVIAALAVATGWTNILGREVTKGRVAYLAFENPDDTRMRFMIAAAHYGIRVRDIRDRVRIFAKCDKPEKICKEVERAGPFSLILIDTYQAFFDGDNINDNSQGVTFLRRVRPMTQMSGKPTVIISAHPIKSASDDNLVPYGAGSVLNEVDGNLTLLNRGKNVELHWQRKFRGIDFSPAHFQIDLAVADDVLDIKGRQIQLPVMQASLARSADEIERADKAASVNGLKLLRAMIAKPNAPQREWQTAIGAKHPSIVTGTLKALKKDALVEHLEGLKQWRVLPKGRALLKASDTPVQEEVCTPPVECVQAECTNPLEAAENMAVPEIRTT